MKIVITGGPGTGKTSIINKLEDIGHTVFHESSREIIQKYKKRLQRNKKPVGRPRKVGRPKGTTKIKEEV